MKKRYFVTASVEGNYLDERLFTFFHDAVQFAAGIATSLSARYSPDGQVIIIDRLKGKVKELYIMDMYGMTADITPRLKKMINRKFRRKSPVKVSLDQEKENAYENSVIKLSK
ncbi:MAG: hypothetical protein WCR56_04355 [Bacilli bacterium]